MLLTNMSEVDRSMQLGVMIEVKEERFVCLGINYNYLFQQDFFLIASE